MAYVLDDIGAAVADTAIDAGQGVAGATGDFLGGTGQFVGSGVADIGEGITGGLFGAGSAAGDAVTGAANTGADVVGTAGEAVGGFLGGALNAKVIILLVLGLGAAYLFLQSGGLSGLAGGM
jgi:hypothetical protein